MVHWSLISFAALVLSISSLLVVFRLRPDLMSGWRMAGLVWLALYLPLVLGLTLGGIPLGPNAADPSEWRRPWANLVPLHTVLSSLDEGLRYGTRQIVGNVLILMPLGFLLPMLSSRFKQIGSTVVVGFSISLAIEVCQLTVSWLVGVPYRVFDVDDLLLNTFGILVGWAMWRFALASDLSEGGRLRSR